MAIFNYLEYLSYTPKGMITAYEFAKNGSKKISDSKRLTGKENEAKEEFLRISPNLNTLLTRLIKSEPSEKASNIFNGTIIILKESNEQPRELKRSVQNKITALELAIPEKQQEFTNSTNINLVGGHGKLSSEIINQVHIELNLKTTFCEKLYYLWLFENSFVEYKDFLDTILLLKDFVQKDKRINSFKDLFLDFKSDGDKIINLLIKHQLIEKDSNRFIVNTFHDEIKHYYPKTLISVILIDLIHKNYLKKHLTNEDFVYVIKNSFSLDVTPHYFGRVLRDYKTKYDYFKLLDFIPTK